jgi:DHA1 family tetracycline resistance protein-like MFS transporter
MLKNFPHRSTLLTVLFVAFLDNLSVGILLPIIPLLLTRGDSTLSILPSSVTDAQGYVIFGFLTAIYTIGQFFSTPILGELSDRYGRKPILMICLTGTCIAYLLFGYGVLIGSLPLLFFARTLDGITGGNISVAQAVIADITEPKDRTKLYGIYGGALSTGFALGPIIGAFFTNSSIVPWFNVTTPFWVTAILLFASVFVIGFGLTETLKQKNHAVTLTIRSIFRSLSGAIHEGVNRILFAGIFIWRLGFSFWTTFGAVFLIYKFHLDQNQLGLYFFYVGIWLIICQIFIVPWLAGKIDHKRTLYWSIFVGAASFLTYLVIEDWHKLFFVIPVAAVANALCFASVPAVVSEVADSHTQGKYSGMSNSVQALAQSIAPIFSGYIAASLSPIVLIIFASVLMVISGLIFLIRQRRLAASLID